MFRTKLIPATMAAVFALSTAGAAVASSGENEITKEVLAALSAKTTISQALAAAEMQTGGRAMKVDLEREKGAYLYEVKTASKDKVFEVFVDPATGMVVRTSEEGFITKLLRDDDRDEYDAAARSPTTLAMAIAAAEKETGGKAMEAKFESDDGKSSFEVEVVKDNAVHKVEIDASNGKVLKVSKDDEHDDKKD